MDGLRAGEVGRIAPLCEGEGVEAQILRLHLHDLFEMRLVPVAAGGVLVDAAPDGVDELALQPQCVARHFFGASVAVRGFAQREFGGVPVEILVGETPAAFLVVVAFEPFGVERGAVLNRKGRRSRGGSGRRTFGTDGRAGRRIVDDRLEQACHRTGRHVALALHQL